MCVQLQQVGARTIPVPLLLSDVELLVGVRDTDVCVSHNAPEHHQDVFPHHALTANQHLLDYLPNTDILHVPSCTVRSASCYGC